jgi:hypothetical protein
LHSGFDQDAEGWSVGLFFSLGSLSPADYQPAGGSTGGYIETTDVNTDNAFRAPAPWLGDQSALFGGVLSFSQRALDTDGLVAAAAVLASGRTRLQYRAPPPGTDWTSYSVQLRAGEWEVGNGTGAASLRLATDAEILAVLSDLDWLAFSADWKAGDDLVGLDEVSITSIIGGVNGPGPVPVEAPEPAAMTSVAGLAALGLILFRRNRK